MTGGVSMGKGNGTAKSRWRGGFSPAGSGSGPSRAEFPVAAGSSPRPVLLPQLPLSWWLGCGKGTVLSWSERFVIIN